MDEKQGTNEPKDETVPGGPANDAPTTTPPQDEMNAGHVSISGSGKPSEGPGDPAWERKQRVLKGEERI